MKPTARLATEDGEDGRTVFLTSRVVGSDFRRRLGRIPSVEAIKMRPGKMSSIKGERLYVLSASGHGFCVTASEARRLAGFDSRDDHERRQAARLMLIECGLSTSSHVDSMCESTILQYWKKVRFWNGIVKMIGVWGDVYEVLES